MCRTQCSVHIVIIMVSLADIFHFSLHGTNNSHRRWHANPLSATEPWQSLFFCQENGSVLTHTTSHFFFLSNWVTPTRPLEFNANLDFSGLSPQKPSIRSATRPSHVSNFSYICGQADAYTLWYSTWDCISIWDPCIELNVENWIQYKRKKWK